MVPRRLHEANEIMMSSRAFTLPTRKLASTRSKDTWEDNMVSLTLYIYIMTFLGKTDNNESARSRILVTDRSFTAAWSGAQCSKTDIFLSN